MKDPYSVLGLTPDAGEEELRARYETLKAEYGEQRFKEGEEGNEGARKLSELEAAWAQISADLSKQEAQEKFGDGDYGEIDDLITKGNYNDAQERLDAITDRGAQWHYLQSIIYYKREWLSDSREQLQKAVDLDPTNEKYKTALQKLDMVIGNPQTDARTLGADPAPDNNGQLCGGNALSNCCLAYCLTDCCCQMMRCCG